MNQKRLVWIDIARGYAILIIVTAHVGLIPFTEFLQAFQLPLFAIISALTIKTEYLFLPEIYKKFKSWVIPYFPTILLSSILWNLLFQKLSPYNILQLSLTDQLISIVSAQNIIFNGPLWFLPSFFIAFVIYSSIIKLKIPYISLSFLRILLIVTLFTIGYILVKNFPRLYYSIDLSFIFAGFILLTKESIKIIKLEKILNFPIIALCLLLFITSTLFNGSVNFYGRVFNNYFLFLINSLLGSLIILYLAQKTALLKGDFTNAIGYLGKNTMPIYLFHWLILLAENTIIFNLPNLAFKLQASISFINIVLPHSTKPTDLLIRVLLFLILLSSAILIPLIFYRLWRERKNIY